MSRPKDCSTLKMKVVEGEDESLTMARLLLSPEALASLTLVAYSSSPEHARAEHVLAALTEQLKALQSGSLDRSESALLVQAHTLDAIFNQLALLSKNNLGKNFDVAERLLRLALKAQSQSRATLETLLQAKNPSGVAFVRQANIANGPQQVNNCYPRAENEIRPNKLLDNEIGKQLDGRTQSEGGRGDQTLEAVGQVNGAAVGSWETEILAQRL